MFLYSKSKKVPFAENEARLWELLRTGSREALNKLFKLHYSALFDYGRKLVSDSDLVKDAIQKLFLRLWKTHANLGSADSVEAYLLVSLRRILLRKVKKRHKRFERNKTYLDHLFTASFSAEELIIRDERDHQKKQKLQEAVNKLNGRQKEALFLRYYHGLTNKEIALVMDINQQSVRNHLSRALKSLRTLLHNRSRISE